MVRMHLSDRSGARSAYKSALSAFKDELSLDPTHSQARIHRAFVLVILGDPDTARSEMEKARAKYPDDRLLRNFAENHGMDKMLADPDLKSLSP
jgi:Flp pilus assembly protein TadD